MTDRELHDGDSGRRFDGPDSDQTTAATPFDSENGDATTGDSRTTPAQEDWADREAVHGDGATYEWHLDDGTVLTGRKVTHVYEDGGEYDVELKVQLSTGRPRRYEVAIHVDAMYSAVDPGRVVNRVRFEARNPVTTGSEFWPNGTDRADLDPVGYDPVNRVLTYECCVQVPALDADEYSVVLTQEPPEFASRDVGGRWSDV